MIIFSCDDCGLTQSDILSIHECVEYYDEIKSCKNEKFCVEDNNTIIYSSK